MRTLPPTRLCATPRAASTSQNGKGHNCGSLLRKWIQEARKQKSRTEGFIHGRAAAFATSLTASYLTSRWAVIACTPQALHLSAFIKAPNASVNWVDWTSIHWYSSKLNRVLFSLLQALFMGASCQCRWERHWHWRGINGGGISVCGVAQA